MDARLKRIMGRFHPDGLCDQYFEQYKFENGEKQLLEIINKIESSPKVNDYISNCLNSRIFPSPKGLEVLMNTITYFMFSKEETLCLGALATFYLWKTNYIQSLGIDDVLEQESVEKPLAEICAELIYNCSINKYNKSDNFFLRFFKRITIIDRENPE
jgi:hypothetical protein